MAKHVLKIDPGMIGVVEAGLLKTQISLNDRDYKAGDELELRETAFSAVQMIAGKPLRYTGVVCEADVLHVLEGRQYGLYSGYVALSIRARGVGAVVSLPDEPCSVCGGSRYAFDLCFVCGRSGEIDTADGLETSPECMGDVADICPGCLGEVKEAA